MFIVLKGGARGHQVLQPSCVSDISLTTSTLSSLMGLLRSTPTSRRRVNF